LKNGLKTELPLSENQQSVEVGNWTGNAAWMGEIRNSNFWPENLK
jgi:hypothetical protein